MVKKVQQEYVVKQIIDRRDEKIPATGKTQTLYKVLWLGYPQSQATWENSRKLMRHPQLRKDIQLFNQKRKNIIKEAKNSSKPKKNKTISKSFSIETQKSTKTPVTKNSSESATAVKLNKSQVTSPVSKESKSKNDNVVGEILSKIRENENLTKNIKGSSSKKKDPIVLEQTGKKIANKVQERLTAIKDKPKQTKRVTKKGSQYTHKSFDSDKVFPQPKIKLTDIICQPKQLQPIVEQNKESHLKNVTNSASKPSIEQPILDKSKDKQITEDKSNGLIQKIKLQLTEELIPKEQATKNKVSEQVGTEKDDEFDIKGMIMCKNEYFYLVEENGKSQILSRAEILNTHPYELIVFYEKRINIRPAEINMMVL